MNRSKMNIVVRKNSNVDIIISRGRAQPASTSGDTLCYVLTLHMYTRR